MDFCSGIKSCPGIQFEPTDDEIVSFLKAAAEGSQIPNDAAECIYRVDLYGDKPPWEIFANEFPAKRVFYALTTLKTTSEHRLKRTAGVGTWKGPNARTKLPLGEKYGMTYSIEDAKSNIKKKTTHWNMTEYRLFNYNSYKTSSSSEGEYAFCRVVYSKKYVQPEYLPLQRPCVDSVYNACQPEGGIRMPDIYNSSSVTTCTSLGGGQVASQCFNPNQNICYGNSFTSAYNIVEGQEVQQQQSAAPSTANIQDTDIYKELSAMVNGSNATRGAESSGVNNSQVFDSMEVTENFYGVTATNTCNGLMSEQQPVIYSDGQPNAEDLLWSATAATTCTGLVLEQQPFINSEGQPNADVWRWSPTAATTCNGLVLRQEFANYNDFSIDAFRPDPLSHMDVVDREYALDQVSQETVRDYDLFKKTVWEIATELKFGEDDVDAPYSTEDDTEGTEARTNKEDDTDEFASFLENHLEHD